MSYSTDVASLLARQLAKFATLNRHQLAGQAANLDFWLDEVCHCIGVIDGYGRRFEGLKAAQLGYTSEHNTKEYLLWDPCCTETTARPPNRVPHAELKEARRSACDAAYRFLVRCFAEEFISESALRDACARLEIGVETSDLKR